MTVFFCSVGYTACFRLLKKGGVQVLLFLLVSIIMVALQNGLGAILAGAFHLDPRLGLAVGSIPMVGGHGTAGAFGPVLEEAGVAGANAVCDRIRNLRSCCRLYDRRTARLPSYPFPELKVHRDCYRQ